MSVTARTTDQDFISTLAPIWEYSDQMLQSTCSACHSTPPTTRYTANGWIAGLKAMSTYYRLNPVEERTLLKYLQTHASDVSDTNKSKDNVWIFMTLIRPAAVFSAVCWRWVLPAHWRLIR